jgi:alanine racemase
VIGTATSHAVIDREAYAHNLNEARSRLPADCRLMAVVKADGYGHGMAPIAEAAVAFGVDMLGVATVEEGVQLRDAGIKAPILVMVQPADSVLTLAIEHDLRLSVSTVPLAERICDIARRLNHVVPVHCKIDTGMCRQGFDPEAAASDLQQLTRLSHIDIEAIWTHYAVANAVRDPATANQAKLFRQVLKKLDRVGVPYEFAHAGNSAALVNYPDHVFDMARVGLMTYGVWPSDNVPEKSPLRPVMRWETEIVLIKNLDKGMSIGYGATYTTSSPTKVALIPVGYADGYRHALSNRASALVRGKRCPVRGRISMDQTTIDVTGVPDAEVGDAVTLIGSDGNESITVQELADRASVLPYEIMTGVQNRARRVYPES